MIRIFRRLRMQQHLRNVEKAMEVFCRMLERECR
ncbi:MAG TPA: hypothetical protein DCG24_00380 [Bacteroidetes bacterium]|nr:hypothetical protein [Bacteroidota bacterium]HAE34593.1 hypothetical protein [Bacteroidota bacterium]